MKIIIAGDFCPRTRTAGLIEDGRFDYIFGNIKPIIELADYSLVNFECPVVASPNAKPILKCGPNLRCSVNAIEAIKYTGFQGVTLANNHILDYGADGLEDTLIACKEANIDVVGVGGNVKEASRSMYKHIEGKNIAFINCCEHEFSTATDTKPGANPLNPIQQYYSIREARKNADYVIVIVHGGHEHFQLPSPRMKELYRFFVDCGADVVVNHHQHCYSGYEEYKSKYIFYGLGNFCFDNDNFRKGGWTEGYLLELLIKDKIEFKIVPYVQCATEPKVVLMNHDEIVEFDKQISLINSTINDDAKLYVEHQLWMNGTKRVYELPLSPYSNKYMQIGAYKGWLPLFISKKRALRLINYIGCEAHRDRLINCLYSKFK